VTLSVAVTDTLDGIGSDELVALDGSTGALGCRGRLVQLAGDPRWEPRYVTVRDGDRLRAVLPIYLGHGKGWSDQIHSPEAWGWSGSPVQGGSALVGGRLEIRGSLRCADDPVVLREVADACAAIGDLSGRELFFGYLDERQQRLAEALFGPVEWLEAYDDFVYPERVIRGSLDEASRSVRQTIRNGERKLEEHQVTATVLPWVEYAGDGCALIAAHNRTKGMVDHPELVRYRMDRWAECDEVEVLVVAATAGEIEGVVSLLLFRDEMEVYEIGLPDGEGASRRALYTCLTFYEPRRVARERAVRTVRAGLGTAQPKRMRGAEAVHRRSGRALRVPGRST
jgi:hypothetical protein